MESVPDFWSATPTRSNRRVLARAIVVTAALGAMAPGAAAEHASTPMTVSVTVVRSCAVTSESAHGSVTLSCSKSTTRVAVGEGSAPEVRTVSGQTGVILAPAQTKPPSPPSAPSSEPRRVTINF